MSKQMVDEIDVDGNGIIDFDEFRKDKQYFGHTFMDIKLKFPRKIQL